MPHIADVWQYFVLAAVLVIAAVTDLRSGKVYNWLTYPAIAVGLIGHTLLGGWGGADKMGLLGAAGGLAAGFLPMLAAYLAGGLGGGDAKLMGAVGALAGWRFAISAMFFGLLIAALMALGVLLYKRMLADTFKRLGRFVFLLLTPGKPADPTTPDSPKVPVSLAFAMGAGVALVEVIIRGGEAPKWFLGI